MIPNRALFYRRDAQLVKNWTVSTVYDTFTANGYGVDIYHPLDVITFAAHSSSTNICVTTVIFSVTSRIDQNTNAVMNDKQGLSVCTILSPLHFDILLGATP